MNLTDYQWSARRFGKELPKEEQLVRAVFGLLGESGELVDALKKWRFQGHKKPREYDLLSEIGDVLWYLQDLCGALGLSLEEAASLNIAKLSNRYPDGFSEEASRARVDEC